jgi:hypothetical protein
MRQWAAILRALELAILSQPQRGESSIAKGDLAELHASPRGSLLLDRNREGRKARGFGSSFGRSMALEH